MTKQKEKDRWTKLAEAADELNEVLGLDPAIQVNNVSEEDLEEKLNEASELILPDDEFSGQTEKILAEFSDGISEEEEEEVKKPEPEPEPEENKNSEEDEFDEEFADFEDAVELNEEDEAEAVDIDEAIVELTEEVENASKRKQLRILSQENEHIFPEVVENLPNLKSSKALKTAMLKRLKELNTIPNWDEAVEEEKQEAKEQEEKEEIEQKEKSSVTKAKPPREGTKTAKAIKFITPYIEKEKYTEDELIDLIDENVNIAWSTAHMLIAKAKNPKYCRFPRVLEKDSETDIISFKEN